MPSARIARALWWVAVQVVLVGAALGCAVVAGGSVARAQQEGGSEGDAGGESLGGDVFLLPPRELLQKLAAAKLLLSQNRFDEAAAVLASVLEAPRDYFFQPDRQHAPQLHRSLKGEAQRWIGLMPARGRELYELRFGPQARQQLDLAVARGDGAKLAEVSRQFFHTAAGHEATFLLGVDHLDHGRPLAAALMLDRLRQSPGAERFEPSLSLYLAAAWFRSGGADRAGEVLTALRLNRPQGLVEVAGRSVLLPDDSRELVSWLRDAVGAPATPAPDRAERWAMYRGDPARNLAVRGDVPLLNLRWHVPTAESSEVEQLLRDMRRVYRDQNLVVLPALCPVAVNDVVLMRTDRELVAVDFRTGKRMWAAPGGGVIAAYASELPGDATAEALLRQSPQAAVGLTERVWEDLTYGTLSTDGRAVYCIEDLEPVRHPQQHRAVIINGRRVEQEQRRAFNRLAAYDLRTGKLKWYVGGANDQYAAPLADTFFLGPPLPLLDQLFVLAEPNGQSSIELWVLDAARGRLVWSQPLVVAEQGVLMDRARRLAGASPSYAEGVVVCPTANGAIVAIDLATRSLLWGYRYARPDDARNRRAMFGVVALAENQLGATPRWLEPTVVVAEGCVVATPTDSDALHVLGLFDGKPRFRPLPRGDALYLAAVHRGKAVLVARRDVRAVELDGSSESEPARPAWQGRTVALPDGATPSGRGLLAGDLYYVPLDSGEIAAIDLVEGKLAGRYRMRQGGSPGNLLCYQGYLISHGIDGLSVLHQRGTALAEMERRAALDPDDPEALVLRGEVLRAEGRHAEAVAAFREAYRRRGDNRRRDLLRDALIEALDRDFAAEHDAAEEIESLLDEPEHWAAYLERLAERRRRAGDWLGAFDALDRLRGIGPLRAAMVSVEPELEVRRARWIRARLAELRRDATDPAAVEEMDRRVEARCRQAADDASPEALRRWLEDYADWPSAPAARRALVEKLREAGDVLEIELLLGEELESGDPARVAPALAELAAALQRAGLPEDAAICYRRLGGELAEVACRPGQTGAELCAALPADSPVRAALAAAPTWPAGRVEVSKDRADGVRQIARARFVMQYIGNPGPFYAGRSIALDQNNRLLVGCDALGRAQWRVSLAEVTQNAGLPFNREWTQVAVRNHLVLASLGYQIVALDASAAAGESGPKILWHHDLTEPGLHAAVMARVGIPVANMPWILQQVHFSRYGTRLNSLGPAGARLVCYQRMRTLLAVDPLSGETLWRRHDVPLGSELFGDDELIFAIAPESDEAMVFSAVDGRLVGRRKVPRLRNENAAQDDPFGQPTFLPLRTTAIRALGRRLVVWRVDRVERVLELYDAWEEKPVWAPRRFDDDAIINVLEDRWAAVAEPDGRLVVLGLLDGRTLVEAKLDPGESAPALAGLWLLRHEGRFLVVTSHAAVDDTVLNAQNRQFVQPLPGVFSQPIQLGWAYGFDEDGKPAWPKPVKIEKQQLIVDQPPGLPVLVFATRMILPNQNGEARFRLGILAIDKRSGRVVCRYDDEGQVHTFELSADPQRHTISATTQQHVITMRLTDEPWPEGDQSLPPVENKQLEMPRTLRTLFRSVLEPGAPASQGEP